MPFIFPEALKGFCNLWSIYPSKFYVCTVWGAELSGPLESWENSGLFPGLKNRYISCCKLQPQFFIKSFQEIKNKGGK